jgi:hypothetical protein
MHELGNESAVEVLHRQRPSSRRGWQTEEMATNDDRATEACMGMPNYRDFSQVTASDDDAIQPLLDIGMGGDRGAGGRQDMHVSNRNFPVKLHFMLQDVEEEGLTHIVSWAPHGRSFMVHRMNDFVEIVLARYVRIPVVLARAEGPSEAHICLPLPLAPFSILLVGFVKQRLPRFSVS